MSRHASPRRARGAAWGLACAAVVMVFVAVAAVFVPAGKPKTTTALRPRGPHLSAFIHPRPGTYPPPSSSASASPSSQSPSPSTQAPVAAAPRTVYPPPMTVYPAPSTVYPAPSPAPQPSKTYPPPPPSPPPDPGADLPPPVPLHPPINGVVTTDVPGFNSMTHSRAQLAVSYVSMSRPLAKSFLHSAMRVAAGAEVMIEMTPTAPGHPALSLEAIASGYADGWLRAMRRQIQALHRPVVLSFAPEANGHWYAWGQDPAGFIAAWHHVHAIIGTPYVTWLWQMSAHNPGDPATQAIAAYWPGSSLVDIAGLDGYMYRPGDTFARRFNISLADLGRIWGGPVIIAETAVSPATNNMAADITDLFNGVTSRGLLGLIYLNLKPNGGGFFHPDFRLENYPAALAAYVKAVSTW